MVIYFFNGRLCGENAKLSRSMMLMETLFRLFRRNENTADGHSIQVRHYRHHFADYVM